MPGPSQVTRDKSVNTHEDHQVCGGVQQEVGRGATDPPLQDGGVFRVRAVPGAEIYHLEKKVNTESFFVRLVRSADIVNKDLKVMAPCTVLKLVHASTDPKAVGI